MSAPGSRAWHRWELVCGAVVFIGGVALRAWGLSDVSLDQDEIYTQMEAASLFGTKLQPGIDARPLYYILQHLYMSVVPHSAAWLRLPAFVFGAAGVVATWLLARRVGGRVSGIGALVFVSVSPWHLYASGMDRYWSLVYLASATFWLAYLRARESEARQDFVVALLPFVVGCLSHPTYLFPLPVALLLFQFVGEDGRVRWSGPSRQEMIGLWGPATLALGGWWLLLKLTGDASSVRNFDGRGPAAALRLLPAMIQWMTPTVAAAACAGMLAGVFRLGPESRWGWVGVTGVVSGATLLLAASQVTDVYADYGIALLPFVFVASGVAVGAFRFARGGDRADAVAPILTIGIVLAGVLPSTVSHLSDGTRFDYRPAFSRIRAAAPEALVLVAPLVQARVYGTELRSSQLLPNRAALDSTLATERDLWVVASVQRYGMLYDDEGQLRGWLHDRCSQDGAWERSRLDYRNYRVELYRCTLD